MNRKSASKWLTEIADKRKATPDTTLARGLVATKHTQFCRHL